MASGPVACQIVTRRGRALALGADGSNPDNSSFCYIAATQTCSTVWCTIRRTLLTFQVPFNCSKGSQIWCMQSCQMSAKGKAFEWRKASKIPPRFLREAVTLWCVQTSWLTLWSSLVKCFMVLSFFLDSPRQCAWTPGFRLLEAEQQEGSLHVHRKWHWVLSEALVSNPSSSTCLQVQGKSL